MTQPTPTHLLPERCYVCGDTQHRPTPLHVFESNADAARREAAEAARHRTTLDPAAQYVATYRPY